MQLEIPLECVRSLPRVSGDCQDGAREFVGRRSRLVERLLRVAERVAGSWEGLEVDLRSPLLLASVVLASGHPYGRSPPLPTSGLPMSVVPASVDSMGKRLPIDVTRTH
ncbi:hypothetical protein BHE74_00017446 [Ensete ventricosum]|nr:hypothetical protein GW17_00037826 [Ensete ventricosum]RWW74606.1 hypothetical protein BHE74_00017446 [Ensete ventricosum]RZS12104.1 hypothetical protein BHM03_00043506 [Ensete ventricosum]